MRLTMKFISAVAFAVVIFFVSRIVAYYFGLDELARGLAQRAKLMPSEMGHVAIWIICAFIGLIVLVATLIFDPWTRIVETISERPRLGSLALEGQPTFILTINQRIGVAEAECYVDLLNSNDQMVQFKAILRATVNGKDLPAPLHTSGYVSPQRATRLVIRMSDVPLIERPAAAFHYDVVYKFSGSSRTRRTVKGIEWQSRLPLNPPPLERAERLVEQRSELTTTYFEQIEE